MRKTSTVVAPVAMHLLESRCLLSAGQLDPSFDADGFAPANWGAQAHEAVVLSSGKILVAGTIVRNDPDYGDYHAAAVARYNPNGTLDASFSVNGVTPPALLDFGPTQTVEARDLAVQSDGKIIVALSEADRSFLVRLNPDGTRDRTFVTVIGGPGTGSQSLAIASDNKILFWGYRYNADGSYDSTFNPQYFDFGPNALDPFFYFAGNAIQPDGKTVGTGVIQLRNGNWAYAAYRLNPDGTMDTTFHGGHVYIEDPKLQPFFTGGRPDVFQSALGGTMMLLPDGSVEIAVGSQNRDASGRATLELRAARFTNRGSADSTFGVGGIAGTGLNMVPMDVERQTDGKLVFAGFNADSVDPPSGHWLNATFAATRLNANGSIDSSFHLDSRLDSQSGAAYGLAIQPDNKLIPVGGTVLWQFWDPPGTAVVSRLLNDGTVQPPPPPPPPPPPTGAQKPLRWPFGEREIIQAEDYDLGGEGVAYHDSTPGNQSGTYRANEGVDVGDITGGRVVGRANQGEWLEYTIRSPFTTTRNFSMQARYVTPKSGVTLNYYIDGRKVGSVALPPTGSYGGTYQLASTTIAIPAGTHVLRVEFASGGNDVGNFDWFRFVAQ
jgi:uncharacterized delta-60 repeat protein